VDARRLRRAVGDSRLAHARTGALGRLRCAEGKHVPVRSAFVGPPSHWLIVIWSSKTYRSFWFRAFGLSCLPRARRERAALRAHREQKENEAARG